MANNRNYAVALLSGGNVVTRWQESGCDRETDLDAFFAPVLERHFVGQSVARAAVCEMRAMDETIGSLPFDCVYVDAKSNVPASAVAVLPFGLTEQDIGESDIVVFVDPARASP